MSAKGDEPARQMIQNKLWKFQRKANSGCNGHIDGYHVIDSLA